jgi:hypothetical protein
MSMIGSYVRLGAEQFEWAQEYVEELSESIYAEETEGAEKVTAIFDVDKAWDGLRFLLAKAEDAPVDVVLGGSLLGEADWGYGPARYLTPEEVDAAARYLDSVDFDRLAEHFDAAGMREANVYPAIWGDGDSDLDYLRSTSLGWWHFSPRPRLGTKVSSCDWCDRWRAGGLSSVRETIRSRVSHRGGRVPLRCGHVGRGVRIAGPTVTYRVGPGDRAGVRQACRDRPMPEVAGSSRRGTRGLARRESQQTQGSPVAVPRFDRCPGGPWGREPVRGVLEVLPRSEAW